jgi:nucleoid-associated protein YgaU
VLAAYLLTGAGLGALRHLLPSPRVLDALLARVLPRALRRVVDVAVGTTTVAAVLAAPAAAHADARPGAVTAVSDLDWPGLVQAVSPAPGPQPAAAPASAVLVVRPGDSLWTLAARRLGPHASPAAVAAEWPRLYAANRAVIGADPSLLRPGQHLRVPAHDLEDQP